MATHPVNLALRFLLEIAALVGLALIGPALTDGWVAAAIAVVLVVAGLTAWGTFNVPGDASRSGRAPVPVPGPIRLVIEVLVFGGGLLGWLLAGSPVAWVIAVLLVVHHIASWERLRWLVANG